MVSEMYVFETINNQECVRYEGVYNTDGSFNFHRDPYFTMIYTDYDGSSYSIAKTRNGNSITNGDINSMLFFDIKVDLYVDGATGGDLILSLIKTDSNYAYFGNGRFTLKVDMDGNVIDNN